VHHLGARRCCRQSQGDDLHLRSPERIIAADSLEDFEGGPLQGQGESREASFMGSFAAIVIFDAPFELLFL
jgi:hypothetical protein